MSLRGRGAIVGIGEVPTRRIYEGRSMYGLCAEAAGLAIADAGITKDDIDGLVTDGVARHQTQFCNRGFHARRQWRHSYYGSNIRRQQWYMQYRTGGNGKFPTRC